MCINNKSISLTYDSIFSNLDIIFFMKLLKKKLVIVFLLNIFFYLNFNLGIFALFIALADALTIIYLKKYFDYVKIWNEVVHIGLFKFFISYSYTGEITITSVSCLLYLSTYTVFDFFYHHKFFKTSV